MKTQIKSKTYIEGPDFHGNPQQSWEVGDLVTVAKIGRTGKIEAIDEMATITVCGQAFATTDLIAEWPR